MMIHSLVRRLTIVATAVVSTSMSFGSFHHPGFLHTEAQLDRVTGGPAAAQVVSLADAMLAERSDAVAIFDIPGYFQDPTGQQGKVRQFQTDVRAAYTCALAFQLTGKAAYAATAKRLVLSWVDTNTAIRGFDGPIVMSYLGVGLLISADLVWDTFSAQELERIRKWAGGVYLVQAVNPEQSNHENNHRTWGIFAGMAVAHVRDDATLFAAQVARWKDHVRATIASDGRMPLELARGGSAGWYTYFALAPMLAAAQAVQNTTGEALWDYNGGSIERALNHLYADYAHPDRLGAGSSCNPENLFQAVREVYPSGRWLTASYLPASPIDASQDQHIAWEFPSLLLATRRRDATSAPGSGASPAPSPGALSVVWLADSANRSMSTVTYLDGIAEPFIEIDDVSRTQGARQNSTRLLAQPDRSYELAVSARRRSGKAISIALVVRDVGGRVLRTSRLQPNLGSWTTLRATIDAPADAATIEIAISSEAKATGTTQIGSCVLRER